MRKVEMLEIKEWVAQGLTTYDPDYITFLIKEGIRTGKPELDKWEMIGGTYRLGKTPKNLKRLGTRKRAPKTSQKSNSGKETT